MMVAIEGLGTSHINLEWSREPVRCYQLVTAGRCANKKSWVRTGTLLINLRLLKNEPFFLSYEKAIKKKL
jgi:hypothetical protein